MKKFLRIIPPYLPTLIVFIAICYLSLAPDPVPDHNHFFNFQGADKVVHFIMYYTLTTTFYIDYRRRSTQPKRLSILLIALLSAIVIGGTVEILQNILPTGRCGDWGDFAADTLGAIIGIITGKYLWRE